MSDDLQKQTAQLIVALRGVLSQVAEPDVVLGAILQQAVTGASADRGLFVEVTDRGELEYRVLSGFQARNFEGDAGAFSRHLFQRVVQTGEDVLLKNAVEDPFFVQVESVQALRTAAVLCMPIRSGDRIVALVHLEKRAPGYFDPRHRTILRSMFEMAGPIIEALRAGRDVIRERDRLRLSENQFRQEAEASREVLATDWSFGRFVGRSSAVRELEQTVRKAAATEFPVLMLGETGTGKSLLVRALHYAGPRASRPLVTVFCPSLEKSMVEAELFGHRRGAFTGAATDRIGKVQAADRGTLFLDEIGELPREIQSKLLRLLQEKTFERVGDPEERRADVRVIAATNRDLDVEVEAGRFRRDLFERLNFIPIRIPPLRERLEDIGLLLRHCLDQTGNGRWIELSPEAVRFLEGLDFSWPDNVRHIEQLAARLTMEGSNGPVTPADLTRLLDAGAAVGRGRRGDGAIDLEAGLPLLLEEAEKSWLEEALRRYPDLTRIELAARLKISESALYKKLRSYDLGA